MIPGNCPEGHQISNIRHTDRCPIKCKKWRDVTGSHFLHLMGHRSTETGQEPCKSRRPRNDCSTILKSGQRISHGRGALRVNFLLCTSFHILVYLFNHAHSHHISVCSMETLLHPTPQIQSKKCCISPKCRPEESFEYSILTALHPTPRNPQRISHYEQWHRALNNP